jgi:hypothetical protein
MTTTGETETKIVKVFDKNGNATSSSLYSQITTIKQRFSQMSPNMKRFLGAYVALGAISMCYDTYNEGKEKLIEVRYYNKNTGLQSKRNEWSYVKNACSDGSFGRFIDNVVWPTKIYSNIMPSIIFKMNEPEDKTNNKN